MNATSNISANYSSLPNAVIFDLDGTLVSSSLDFLALCRETGCTPGNDILQYIKSLPIGDRARVEHIVYEHEMRDAESCMPIPGVHELLAMLHAAEIHTAVVTRNSAEATRMKLENSNLNFEYVITREEAPAKPAPDALLLLASGWQQHPQDCVYVGDYKYDLLAARNANMHAAWFSNQADIIPDYASMADFHFDHFEEFSQRLGEYWKGLN